MVCGNCGAEFDAKRKDARFCKTACRVAYGRKAGVVSVNPPQFDDTAAEPVSVLYACCKHCPKHPHAGHMDACRQGCGS